MWVAKMFGFPIIEIKGSLQDSECEQLLKGAKEAYRIAQEDWDHSMVADLKDYDWYYMEHNFYDWFHEEETFNHREAMIYNKMLIYVMFVDGMTDKNYILPEKAEGFTWHASQEQRCLAFMMMRSYISENSASF